MVSLRPDGPHSPEDTRRAADGMAECVRYLNYATGHHAGQGLAWPADAYDVLGALYTGTGRMDQLFTQLARWLDRQAAAGRLEDDHGADPRDATESAGQALAAAARASAHLTAALEAAQAAISSLHARPGTGEAS